MATITGPERTALFEGRAILRTIIKKIETFNVDTMDEYTPAGASLADVLWRLSVIRLAFQKVNA